MNIHYRNIFNKIPVFVSTDDQQKVKIWGKGMMRINGCKINTDCVVII